MEPRSQGFVVQGVCDINVGSVGQALRSSQNSSQRPLSRQQRRAMMLLAPRTVQRIPSHTRRTSELAELQDKAASYLLTIIRLLRVFLPAGYLCRRGEGGASRSSSPKLFGSASRREYLAPDPDVLKSRFRVLSRLQIGRRQSRRLSISEQCAQLSRRKDSFSLFFPNACNPFAGRAFRPF